MNNEKTKLQLNKSHEGRLQDSLKRTVLINDFLRKYFIGGKVVITPLVECLDENVFMELIEKVQNFDAFTEGNDPYGEHDFGSVDVNGKRYYWKIDYYNTDFTEHSEDKSDPSITERVLTIMRADEY